MTTKKDKTTGLSPEALDEVKSLMPSVTDVLDDDVDSDEDSLEEGGNQDETEEDGDNSDEDSSVEEKSEERGNQEGADKEIAAAISKGTAKADRQLEQVLGLLKDSPEKIAELQESSPELYEKLERRFPDAFNVTEVPVKESKSELVSMLGDLLGAREVQDVESWRDNNNITEADFEPKQAEVVSRAKTLLAEKLVPTWEDAVRFAGEMAFPSSKSKPVNTKKLGKMKGQSVAGSNRVPVVSNDFDDDDKHIMDREGMNESDYKGALKGPIVAPF